MNENKPLFRKWLLAKVEERSPLGDVARDLKSDRDFPRNAKHFTEIVFYLESKNHGWINDEFIINAFQYFVKESPDSYVMPLFSSRFVKLGRTINLSDTGHDIGCDGCGETINYIQDLTFQWQVNDRGRIETAFIDSVEPSRKNPCSQLFRSTPFSSLVFPMHTYQRSLESLIIKDLMPNSTSHEISSSLNYVIKLVSSLREMVKFINLPKAEAQTVTPGRRFDIMNRDHFKCRLCGRKSSDNIILEIDHMHPRSRGGDNSSENLWTLCWECNRGKKAKVVDFTDII